MDPEQIIAELDAMPEGGDNDGLHTRAERLLLDYLKQTRNGLAIAEAFERAADRVPFWYS